MTQQHQRSQTPPGSPSPTARQLWGQRAAAALAAAILVFALFVPADSIMVYEGSTLPQCLLILLAVTVASFTGVAWWPSLDKRVDWSLLVLGLLGLMISTWFALGNSDGRAALNGGWHVVTLLAFGMLVRSLARDRGLARSLASLLLVWSAFQATYALHQYFVSMPEARAAYLIDPEGELQRANINAPPGSELRTQYESRLLGSFEPTGTFALTNSLAVPLSAAIVVLGFWLISASGLVTLAGPATKLAGKPAVPAKAVGLLDRQLTLSTPLLWILLAMVAIAWLLTKSRSAYLAMLGLGVPAIALWIGQRRGGLMGRRLESYALVVGGLILALFAGLGALLASDTLVLREAPKSIAFRLEYWQAASRMILDHPWTGVGLGSFQTYYPQYKVPAASEIIADPHNWIFDIAASCSLVVLSVVLIALARLARGCLNSLRTETAAAGIHVFGIADVASQRWMWTGAALAVILISMVQIGLGQMLDLEATILGLLVGLACVWGLHHVRVEDLVLKLAAGGAVTVMLACLLATGNWQASGIALPWAIWLAVAYPSQPVGRPSPPRVALGLRAVAGLVGLAVWAMFYFGTWMPVNRGWALEQQAADYLRQGDVRRAEQTARLAVEVDSYATSPRTLLAQILAGRAQRAAESLNLAEYREAASALQQAEDELCAADKNSYLNWNMRGEQALTLAAAVGALDRAESLAQAEKAAGYFQSAIDRYPSSVALWAQRAVTLQWLAKNHPQPETATRWDQQSRQAAQQAAQLSQETPHANRQLAAQQVWLPSPLDLAFPDTSVVRPVPGSPWAKAEPLCNLLRSSSHSPSP